MVPVLLGALGLLVILAGALRLRSFSGYRVARSLRVAPQLSIAEAHGEARAGRASYVRVQGRITSDEEFPDENERPLVFRRRKLEVREGGTRWRTLEDEREAVPFGLQERRDYLALDAEALDDGLVVLPREATGRARDLPGRLPPDIPPDALVRHRIDQLSAVEHAVATGVPVLLEDGSIQLTAGAGRPLIVTTLEPSEAMRVLSGDRRGELLLISGALALGFALVALAVVVAIGQLAGAS
ncbi:MAG: hypothetical protein ACR2JZ_05990 [Candidatus Limnocylindrales bacterium]